MVGLCLLQRLPMAVCGAAQISTAYILYALSAPGGIKINTLTPQGTVAVICAIGIAVCVYTCLLAPCIIRRCGFGIHQETQIRPACINLLGLVSFAGTVLAVCYNTSCLLATNALLYSRRASTCSITSLVTADAAKCLIHSAAF